MVVHEHYAHCEEVKPLRGLDLPNGCVVDESKLLFSFEFNQYDVHGKDEEILDVLSVQDTYVFQIPIKGLVKNKILKELLQEDDSIINLKLLIDLDKLQRCLRGILVQLGRGFIDTNHLFVYNSVERLKKEIFSQTYNLYKTDGAMNIFVRLQVANKHYYEDLQEYHQSHLQALLRQMRLLRNEQVDRFSGYEDERIQFVQETGQRQMRSLGNEHVDRFSGYEDEVLEFVQRASWRWSNQKNCLVLPGLQLIPWKQPSTGQKSVKK